MRVPLSVLLVLAALSDPACAGCPPSQVGFSWHAPVPEPRALMDSTVSGRRIAFGLADGRLEIEHPGTIGMMGVETVDCFRLEGAGPGMPVPLVARLLVDGHAATWGCGGTGCYGTFAADLIAGGQTAHAEVTARYAAGSVPLVTALEIPLQVAVGDVFEVRSRLTFNRPPGASHHGGGVALLRFTGVPAGMRVRSERGYDSAVPVQRATWGALKTRYH